jgi:hypothetical protein
VARRPQQVEEVGVARALLHRARQAPLRLLQIGRHARPGLDGVEEDPIVLGERLAELDRLLDVGARLGVGTSMRYLSKNRSTVMKLMAPGGFDPTDLVVAFADEAEELGIAALHSFTFNAVADTRKWQEAIVASS